MRESRDGTSSSARSANDVYVVLPVTINSLDPGTKSARPVPTQAPILCNNIYVDVSLLVALFFERCRLRISSMTVFQDAVYNRSHWVNLYLRKRNSLHARRCSSML